jgi:hypothetical protein
MVRTFVNNAETIYDNPLVNIIVHGQKRKPFILKSGIRHGCLLFPLLVIVLELLSRETQKET